MRRIPRPGPELLGERIEKRATGIGQRGRETNRLGAAVLKCCESSLRFGPKGFSLWAIRSFTHETPPGYGIRCWLHTGVPPRAFLDPHGRVGRALPRAGRRASPPGALSQHRAGHRVVAFCFSRRIPPQWREQHFCGRYLLIVNWLPQTAHSLDSSSTPVSRRFFARHAFEQNNVEENTVKNVSPQT